MNVGQFRIWMDAESGLLHDIVLWKVWAIHKVNAAKTLTIAREKNLDDGEIIECPYSVEFVSSQKATDANFDFENNRVSIPNDKLQGQVKTYILKYCVVFESTPIQPKAECDSKDDLKLISEEI